MAYERGDGTGGSSKITPLATLVSSKKKKTTPESYKKTVEEYTKWYRGDSSAPKSNGFQNSTYTSFVPISGVQNSRPAPQQQQQQRGGQKSPPVSSQQKRESGGYKPSRSGGGGKSTATARAYNEGYRDAVRFEANPYAPGEASPREVRSFSEIYGDSMPDPWRRGQDVRRSFRKIGERLYTPDEPVYQERREMWRPSRMAQPAPAPAPPQPLPPVSPLRRAFPQEVAPAMNQLSPASTAYPSQPRMSRTMRDEIDQYVRNQVYLPYAPMGRWR